MAEYEYEYKNTGNVNIENIVDWLSNNRILVITILSLIPILTFIILGFKNNHYILGCIGISFAITLFILLYAFASKIGKTSHFFLLVFLLVLQFGLIIFFLTQIKKSVSNDMYLNFYNRLTFAKKDATPLSFYDMGNNDNTLELMKGTSYGFALKERFRH